MFCRLPGFKPLPLRRKAPSQICHVPCFGGDGVYLLLFWRKAAFLRTGKIIIYAFAPTNSYEFMQMEIRSVVFAWQYSRGSGVSIRTLFTHFITHFFRMDGEGKSASRWPLLPSACERGITWMGVSLWRSEVSRSLSSILFCSTRFFRCIRSFSGWRLCCRSMFSRDRRQSPVPAS